MPGPDFPLPLSVQRGSGVPLSVQLSQQVRDLVRSGALRSGGRLPSTRALAAEVGVSRAVVEQGYDQLLAEGWLTSRRGSGTFVAQVGPGDGSGGPRSARRNATPNGDASVSELVSLDTGTPWVDTRHEAGWRRAWREVSVAAMPRGYPDPAGLPDLRDEISGYVARTRGILCTRDEVMITSGTTHALGLVLDALRPGAIAVEDPGYRSAVATAVQAGWRPIDVQVDDEGLDVDRLRRVEADDVHAVYVTPAHQHPLGMTMSAPRRLDLLAEAGRRDAVVVEDDYDSEFRYDVAPLPALAQLDRERVVYLSTASKIVHPGLRIGWLVAPVELVERITARRAARHDHPGWPTQRALLSMLRDGYVDRLVRSARRVYAERGRRVMDTLGSYGQVQGTVAGMYVALAMPPELAAAARADCEAAGFDVPSLDGYCRTARSTGLVVGFGGLTDAELDAAVEVLADSLRRHAGAGLSTGQDMSQ